MEDVLAKIGIDFRMVLFSAINFLVFFYLLQRFVLKKLGKSLSYRQNEIKESLENAEKLKNELEHAKERAMKVIADANQQASDILQRYKSEAELLAQQIKKEAEAHVSGLEDQSRKLMAAERDELIENTRNDLAQLVIEASAKLIKEKLDKAEDKKIIMDFLKTLDIQKS